MKNQIKTILLLGVLSALLVGIGGMLGRGYLYGFAALAFLMNFVSYFFADRIILRMYRAQEVTPEQAPWLHSTVQELANAAEIPKPRVFLIPEAQPNAFATGRDPKRGVVALTQGIMDVLSRDELRGVLAHEIAHIKNRDILVATIAAGVATAISYIANALQFMAFFGGSRDGDEGEGSPAGGLLLAFVAPLLGLLLQMAISRSREYLADETGARLCGNPESLARALQKLEVAAHRVPSHAEPATASLFIVNPFAGGEALMNAFSTHPPMAKRIERLLALARSGDFILSR